jgi:hypothetical protein
MISRSLWSGIVLGLALVAGPVLALAADDMQGLTRAQDAVQKHIQALEQARVQVPDQAKAAIDRALTESRALQKELDHDSSGSAQERATGREKALSRVAEVTQKHIAVLTALLDKVPDSAKPAIRHAIQVSQNGSRVAQENLTAQRNASTAGRPDIERPGHVRPEGARPHGRPDGMHGSGGMGGMPRR